MRHSATFVGEVSYILILNDPFPRCFGCFGFRVCLMLFQIKVLCTAILSFILDVFWERSRRSFTLIFVRFLYHMDPDPDQYPTVSESLVLKGNGLVAIKLITVINC